MNMFKKNGGFTLVELIVVIAILAILAGVAIPAYSGYIDKAKEAGDTQIVSAINTAIQAATAANDAEVATVTYTDTGITLTWSGTDAADAAADYAIYMGTNSTVMERYNTFSIDSKGLIVGSYVKP